MVKKKVFIALSSVSMSKKKSFLALPSVKDILVVEKLFFGLFAPGNANLGARLSTLDLLINVACFVKKVINIFNI
jgi:hypothetical protein